MDSRAISAKLKVRKLHPSENYFTPKKHNCLTKNNHWLSQRTYTWLNAQDIYQFRDCKCVCSLRYTHGHDANQAWIDKRECRPLQWEMSITSAHNIVKIAFWQSASLKLSNLCWWDKWQRVLSLLKFFQWDCRVVYRQSAIAMQELQ